MFEPTGDASASPAPLKETLSKPREPVRQVRDAPLREQATAVLVGPCRHQQAVVTGVVRRWPAGAQVSPMLLSMGRLAVVTGKTCTRTFRPLDAAVPITITATPLGRRRKPRPDMAIASIVQPAGETPAAVGPADDDAIDAHACADGSVTGSTAGDPGEDEAWLDSHDPLDLPNHASTALSLLGRINGENRFADAALVFVDRLAWLTGAQRAGLGFLSRTSIRVYALSGTPGLNTEAALLRDLGLAMDEAIEQVSTVVYPSEPGGARVTLAHGRFAMRYGAPVLCTIPILLAQDGERSLVGAISLEFGQNRQLDERAIRFAEHAAALLGPSLYNLRHLDTAPIPRLRRGMPGTRQLLLRQRPRSLLWIGSIGAALLVAGLFIPVTDRVTAPARIEGSIQRQIAAPLQGFIGAVHARPGDRLAAGDLMVELDTRELDLENMKWQAKLAELEKRYSEALASEAQTDVAIARAELGQVHAQLDIVNEKLERMRIRAPFDGMVIDGDLTRSLGAPVQRGESLLTIAPEGRYRVIVEVHERDIGRIAVGQRGRLVTAGEGGDPVALTVEAITPIAISDARGNRFEVQAGMPVHGDSVRPGLQGFAKIDTEPRPVLQQVTERLRQWLRIALWRWQL